MSLLRRRAFPLALAGAACVAAWYLLKRLSGPSGSEAMQSVWDLKIEERPKAAVVGEFAALEEVLDAPAVLVLYGSEYGFAKDVAGKVAADVRAVGVSARVVNMSRHGLVELSAETLVLAVVSTSGDGPATPPPLPPHPAGVPPLEAAPFFEQLPLLPSLPHLRVGVLALGDVSYPKFCQAGRDLERLSINVKSRR